MDRTSQQVIAGFYTSPNVDLIVRLIRQKMGPAGEQFISLLPQLMENFRVRMQKELAGNDPVKKSASGDIVLEQIYALDHAFVEALCDNLPQLPENYAISDGVPVSNGAIGGKLIQRMNPQDALVAWRDRPGRGLTLRDDTQGGKSVYGSRWQDSNLTAPYTNDAPFNDGGIAGRRNYVMGGIDYTDSSQCGMNEYYDAHLGRPAMKKLNDQTRPYWRDAPIGHMLIDEDTKAFTQRIMRSWDGCDGSIPSYRRWLHNRNVDRDNSETFAGTQYDFIQRGYDRTPLLNRIAGIRAVGRERTENGANAPVFSLRTILNPPRDVD